MNSEIDAKEKKSSSPSPGIKLNENDQTFKDIKDLIILEEDEEEEKEEFQTCRNSICLSVTNKDFLSDESHKRCNAKKKKNFFCRAKKKIKIFCVMPKKKKKI